jgi:hypothetical protein
MPRIVRHFFPGALYMPSLAVFRSPFAAFALSLLASFAAARVHESLQIPAGTILPVSIKHTFSSNDSSKNQPIEARIMQDVPLPGGDKIPAGATLSGVVVSTTPSSNDSGSKITFRFDKLEFHHQTIPVVTSFRAMAPMVDVQAAQFPDSPGQSGTPAAWANTTQIGGDIRYGTGGDVRNLKKEKVGKGVSNGVLVRISNPPGSLCQGDSDDDNRLQALWVFSASSCGIYDSKGLTVVSMGRKDPLGEITLAKDKGDLKIDNSTGMLLRVVH